MIHDLGIACIAFGALLVGLGGFYAIDIRNTGRAVALAGIADLAPVNMEHPRDLDLDRKPDLLDQPDDAHGDDTGGQERPGPVSSAERLPVVDLSEVR